MHAHAAHQEPGERLGDGHDDVGPVRGETIQQPSGPWVGPRATVVGMDEAWHTGAAGSEGRLVPNAAVAVDDVRGDRTNLADQRARVEQRPASHGGGDVKPRRAVQVGSVAARKADDQDVAFEARRVDPAHDVHDETLEPARVQVEHHVEDAEGARAHQPRAASRDAAVPAVRPRGPGGQRARPPPS